MSSVNKAIIVGRMGKDPEVRYSTSGMAVCSITVATDFKAKDKDPVTEWHRITLFDRLAEVIGKYTAKGSLIYVEGHLQTRKYEDKNGVEKYVTEIIAGQLQLLSPKSDSEPQRRSDAPTTSGRTPPRQEPRKSTSEVPFDDIDSDLPF